MRAVAERYPAHHAFSMRWWQLLAEHERPRWEEAADAARRARAFLWRVVELLDMMTHITFRASSVGCSPPLTKDDREKLGAIVGASAAALASMPESYPRRLALAYLLVATAEPAPEDENERDRFAHLHKMLRDALETNEAPAAGTVVASLERLLDRLEQRVPFLRFRAVTVWVQQLNRDGTPGSLSEVVAKPNVVDALKKAIAQQLGERAVADALSITILAPSTPVVASLRSTPTAHRYLPT